MTTKALIFGQRHGTAQPSIRSNPRFQRRGKHKAAEKGRSKVPAASAFLARLVFILIQLLHALLLLFFVGSGNILIFALSGLVCIAAYTHLIRREVAENYWVATPLLIYLFAGLIRIGSTPLWALACDLSGEAEAFHFSRHNVRQWIVEGQMLLVLGDALFVTGYTAFQRLFPARRCVTRSETMGPRGTAYRTLLITLPLVALNLVAGEALSTLGKLGNYFSNFGVIAALLLMVLSRRVGCPVPWTVIVITLGLGLVNSLRSYMKQETMALLLPLGLVLIPVLYRKIRRGVSFQTWGVVVACGLIFVIALSWLFTFSQIRRGEFWVTGTYEKVRLNESEVPILPAAEKAAVSLLPWTAEFREYQSLPEGGLWSIFSRQADALPAGWAYNDKLQGGSLGGEFIQTGLISLVPRIIWRDKPNISQGRFVAVRLGQARSVEEATTATHVGGMAAALFLDLGWLWLLVGMPLSGGVFALVSHVFLHRFMVNPFAAIACVAIFVESIRHLESAFDGGLSIYAYLIIVIFPMALIWERYHPLQRQSFTIS